MSLSCAKETKTYDNTLFNDVSHFNVNMHVHSLVLIVNGFTYNV
jgi:hypothetical protein